MTDVLNPNIDDVPSLLSAKTRDVTIATRARPGIVHSSLMLFLHHDRSASLSTMTDYERRRADQIERNKALLKELGIDHRRNEINNSRPKKRQKIERPPQIASRTSSRLASAARPNYNEDGIQQDISKGVGSRQTSRKSTKPSSASISNRDTQTSPEAQERPSSYPDIDSLRSGWTAWKPTEPEPTRDSVTGAFYFTDEPTFQPNKSPAEVLREGAFGGSYFRPYRSKGLGVTIEDDWKELPTEWLEGLNIAKFVTSPVYDPEANKYKVSAGQTLEQWEDAGWMDYRYDVRGWFQWYCRFFQGRRCDDDERQISRWRKCVGETGRWRRTLLKKYVALGIRDVTDEGDDEDAPDVSPVVHQTCHHWAWEVRQDVLDRWWAEGR